MKWKQIEGGGAVSEPARFFIRKRVTGGYYAVYDGDKFLGKRVKLTHAKEFCERLVEGRP
jgi:hypothetical protein